VLVIAGAGEAPHLQRDALRARALGARVAVISPAEVKALVPQAHVEDVVVAAYEADSGYGVASAPASESGRYVKPGPIPVGRGGESGSPEPAPRGP